MGRVTDSRTTLSCPSMATTGARQLPGGPIVWHCRARGPQRGMRGQTGSEGTIRLMLVGSNSPPGCHLRGASGARQGLVKGSEGRGRRATGSAYRQI
jgi:hypothetical protein